MGGYVRPVRARLRPQEVNEIFYYVHVRLIIHIKLIKVDGNAKENNLLY